MGEQLSLAASSTLLQTTSVAVTPMTQTSAEVVPVAGKCHHCHSCTTCAHRLIAATRDAPPISQTYRNGMSENQVGIRMEITFSEAVSYNGYHCSTAQLFAAHHLHNPIG